MGAPTHDNNGGGGKLGEDIKSFLKRISFMMSMIPTDLLLMADSFVCEGGCVCWRLKGYGVPGDR